jgi:hypothetical protein
MAVRLGGLVIPLSINPVVSTVDALGFGGGAPELDCGKNGFRPSFADEGTMKVD